MTKLKAWNIAGWSTAGAASVAAITAPIVVSQQKSNPDTPVSENKINDSKTIKNVNITSQKDNYVVFEFVSTDSKTTTNTLTAVAQIDDSSSVFTIDPKVYVEVKNNKITATVDFDASLVEKTNQKVNFHITFTNSDPNNTWAQTIKGLSLTYSSPFLDNNFEYTGYLFTGQGASLTGNRKFKVGLSPSVDLQSVKINDYKSTSGNITIDTPTISVSESSRIAEISIPYTSTSAEAGDKIAIDLVLSCSTTDNKTYEQEFIIILLASDELYLVEDKVNITNGGDLPWLYWYMALPLGNKETTDDITVEITNQSQALKTPMHLDVYAKQIDYENNFFSVIFEITEGWVDPINVPSITFDLKITKPDTRSKPGYEEGDGSAAWEQEFKNISLTFDKENGEYLLPPVDEVWTEPVVVTPNKSTGIAPVFSPSKTTLMVSDFDWTVEFEMNKEESIADFPTTSFPYLESLIKKTVDPYGKDTVYIDLDAKNWYEAPYDKFKQYLTAKAQEGTNVDVKWNAKFTARKQITMSSGIKRYQKQTFEIKNALWLRYSMS